MYPRLYSVPPKTVGVFCELDDKYFHGACGFGVFGGKLSGPAQDDNEKESSVYCELVCIAQQPGHGQANNLSLDRAYEECRSREEKTRAAARLAAARDDSREDWLQRVCPHIAKITGGRKLQLHVNIGCGAGEHAGELDKVEVHGDEIRVVIDDTNYDRLFHSEAAQEIIAKVIEESSEEV